MFDVLITMFGRDGLVPWPCCELLPGGLIWGDVIGGALIWSAFLALLIAVWRLSRRGPAGRSDAGDSQRLNQIIADLKRTEAERSRLAAIVESSDDAIIGKDLDGVITFWNAGAERLFGYSSAEAVGERVTLLIPPDRQDEETRILSVLRQGGRVDHFESIRLTKDGRLVDVSLTISPLKNSSGQVTGISKIARDISARRRTEAHLRDSAARLRAIVETAGDGIITTDERGSIEGLNTAALRSFGYEAHELLGQNVNVLMPSAHEGEHDGFLANFRATADREVKSADREVVGRRKDGCTFPVELTVSEVQLGDRRIFTGIFRDITERKRAEEAIRDSERVYRAIGESIPYGVWICDAEGRNTYASQSFLDLIGISQEQCSNFGWTGLFDPEDACRTVSAWKECIKSEAMWDHEHNFLGADGQYHPILSRGIPVRDDKGRIVCWAGFNLDISKLKEAEFKFRHLNNTLERRVAERTAELAKTNLVLGEQAQLLDLAHDTILVRTLDGRIVFWNAGAERMYGWTREEAVGQVSHALLKTKFPIPLEQIAAEVLAQGHWEGELIHRRKDGTILVAASRWVVQRDEFGEPHAHIETNNDITERKHAEERFQRQSALLRSILDNMSDGVIVANDQGQFLEFNPAALEMFGECAKAATTEEWSERFGMFLTDKVTPYPADQMPLCRTIRGEVIRDLEVFVRHAQAPEGRWLVIDGRPLKDGDGERTEGLIVCHDISARKRMEQELSRSNAELEKFASIASHDLQEPLRMVSSFTQLLAKRYQGHLDQRANEYIAFAVDGCRRMQELIQDLLDFSRVGRTDRPLALVPGEEVLTEVLVDLHPAIADAGAEITHDPLPVVLADGTQLRQIMRNLIANALKFRSDAAPKVHVSARNDGAYWTFGVADNGIGIDSRHFQRIFDIFQRLHTREEYPGTGIGLAVCKKIVDRHQGEIWVESSLGHGSTFYFTFPTNRSAP